MMKLKYLFDNNDLAKMLLENWEYDVESLELFKYFRISSNAVYPFKLDNKVYYLRFAPASEKSLANIIAELEFIKYLSSSGYPSVEVQLSKNGKELEVLQTPWGEYYSVVFKGVSGVQIEDTGFDDDIVFGYGKLLGKLHKLSSKYTPQEVKRWSWNDALEWVCNVLSSFPDEALALKEAKILQDYLSTIPATEENFGLVHYDFEVDNVFYDKDSKSYSIIDFDDSMYHWYVMDIEQAIDSIQEEIEQERYKHAVECFMNGYRSEFEVTDDMLSLMPIFRRFANLYGYTRILRSTSEKWDNEPEWMTGLRKHLEQSLSSRAIHFGKNII